MGTSESMRTSKSLKKPSYIFSSTSSPEDSDGSVIFSPTSISSWIMNQQNLSCSTTTTTRTMDESSKRSFLGSGTRSQSRLYSYVTLFLVVSAALSKTTQALLCYETDGEGNAQLTNTTNDFCVFWPDSLSDETDVSLFSVGPDNDAVKEYRNVFKLSHKPEFDVLSMCVFERYNIGAVDYAFRCFCNFDRCNKAMNMDGFMKRLVNLHD